jgi:hypothetical protein
MKKLKLVIIGAALAGLAIPSAASADVPRCEASAPVNTTVTTATFTALQPRNTTHQFDEVWKHDFTVTVDADGSFHGRGVTTNGLDSNTAWAEGITGSFSADRTHVSFDTVPDGGGATFKVTDAAYNVEVNVDTSGTWTANSVEMKISQPVFTDVVTTTPGTASVKNHGQSVKALGGGKAAAQACAGMPLNSTQGK